MNGRLRVQPWGLLMFEGRGAGRDGEKMAKGENYVIEPRSVLGKRPRL